MGASVEPTTRAPGLIAGRYALGETLGSGATARVFAARDTWLGSREVALKILATADPMLGARLRNEAALLLALRHPHIVAAHELLSADSPRSVVPAVDAAAMPERGLVLVLERLHGMTADRLPEPLAPAAAAAVGAQVAATLAYLHASGLRHGDVSPANIHLRASGGTHATLIDFGFAARATELPATGTPAYASPETLAGSPCAAGDVYALAATLHALLGLRRGPSLFGRPIDDSPLGPALAAMTHPEPARRADAATAFELLLAHVVPGETLEALRALRETPLTRAPLVASPAREAKLEAWLAAASTRTSTLRVVGRAGAGKTAALRAAHGHALRHGFDAPGGVLPGEAGSLEPLARLLRGLGAVVPDLTRALRDDANGQWRAFAALAEALAPVTRIAPLALCFDDVPPGSPLDELARFLERMGGRAPRLALALSSHEGPTGTTTLELNPLEDAAVATLLGSLRPLRPQDRRAAVELQAASGGAPGVIVALSTALPGDALLDAAERHELDSTAAADRLVESRLASAPARARDLAGAVAWLGHTVDPAELRGLGPAFERDDTALLDDLCARGLLAWTHSVGHASLQVAAEALRPALRRCLRPEALRALAEARRAADDPRHAEIAEIWLALGERASARPFLEKAARQALGELRTRDALTLWRAARALVTDGSPEARRIELEIGETHLARGELEDARAAFERAHPLPTSRTLLARTLIQLGRHRAAVERLQLPDAPKDESTAEVESLRARALLLAGERESAVAAVAAALERDPAHPRLADLRGVEGLVASYAGDHARARALLEQAVQLAAATTVPGAADTARANLALALHRAGDLAGATRLYLETLQSAKDQHDLARQLLRLTNLATLRQEQGDSEAALRAYREAHELARLTHNELARTRIELNLANQLAWLGERGEARALAASAIATAEELGLGTELAYLEMLNAELDIGDARTAAARPVLATARAAFVAAGNRAGELECDVLDAAAAARDGAADDARRLGLVASEGARALGRARLAARACLYGALGCVSADDDGVVKSALELARSGVADAERVGESDLTWQLRALEVRYLDRLGRGVEAERARERGREALVRARGATPARYERGYESVWHRAQLLASLAGDAPRASGPLSRDVERLLAINRELARDHDSERLLERIIDAAIALSGAERGFIVLVAHGAGGGSVPGELVIRAARNIDPESAAQLDLGISRSIAQQAMQSGMPVVTVDALGDERFRAYASVHELKLRSVLCLPLRDEAGPLGALYLDNRYRVSAFGDADVALLTAFGDQAAMALAHARHVEALERGRAELERMRGELEELNARLATELAAQTDELEHARQSAATGSSAEGSLRHGLVGRSRPMLEVLRVIERVSDKDVPVTILGESGTGKELVARALHNASGKRSGPFVAVNCGAIPGPLLESELFGHERGAFTGAVRSKPGLFEVAINGTIFLDEVAELPLDMQVKLLRVLQQREFRRVGGTRDIGTNARVVSATNRDLEAMVRAGTFREDLWYRLNVVELRLPPLRERKEDLPLLVQHLLTLRGGDQAPKLSRAALAAVLDYDWPGNVRELDNELQRGIALSERGVIDVEVLSRKVAPAGRAASAADVPASASPLKDRVDQFELAVIRDCLERHGGRVSAAASELGLTRAGLYKKIHKHGLNGDNPARDVDEC